MLFVTNHHLLVWLMDPNKVVTFLANGSIIEQTDDV